jgi:hypothetical protein
MTHQRASGPPEPSQPYLRLSTFRPEIAPHELDTWLRQAVSVYASQAGHIWTCVGRRAVGATDEHAWASLWSSAEAHDRAFESDPVMTVEQEARTRVVGAMAELLPVRIKAIVPRARPMTILRLFRGRTHPGQRDAYLAEAEVGAAEDGARADGPGAIACCTVGADEFVTASVWVDWPSIEACTGGDVHRPLTTRNAARIAAGGPTHFEIVAFESGVEALATS